MVSVATSEDVREAFQKNFSELVMDLNAKAIADDLLTENIIDFDLHCDLLSSGEEDANVHLVKYFCKSSTPRLMEHFENVLSRSSTKFPKHANLAYKLVKEIKMQSSKKMRDSKVIDSAFSDIQGSLAFPEVKEVGWNVDSPSSTEDVGQPMNKQTHVVLPTFEQIKSSAEAGEEKPSDELDKAIDQIVEKLKTTSETGHSPQISAKPVGFSSDSPIMSWKFPSGGDSPHFPPGGPRLLVQPHGSPRMLHKGSPKYSNSPLSESKSSHSGVKAPRKLQVNLLLLGDSRVGKSSLRQQYVRKQFVSKYKATGGCDYLARDLMLDNKSVFVKVWDSIGSVKYRSMAYTFYSAADACVLVFDLNNPASFQHLEDWRTTFLQKTGTQNFPFVVIGNKMDLVQDGERPISTERVRCWCESLNLPYFETSAKDEIGVEMAFVGIARFVVEWMSGKACPQPTRHPNPEESTQL
jgi:Ras-related protein Rab-7A